MLCAALGEEEIEFCTGEGIAGRSRCRSNEHRAMSVNVDQVVTASAIIVGTLVVATVVDRAMRKRADTGLPPAARTRFNALRHTIQAAIIVVGIGMALFVFPNVRGVAGAILSSAAFLSIVVGLPPRRVSATSSRVS